MQLDVHYCAVKVLAHFSGFGDEDAQTIAFASQYVDDATEHKGILVTHLPDALEEVLRSRNMLNAAGDFEPVCTAHKGIQFLSGLREAVQRKVYVPFHFIPGSPKEPLMPFDYRAVPGGQIVSQLLDHWLGQLGDEQQFGGSVAVLVGIGVALHSYADTWSHQCFSGRHNPEWNDIEHISILKEGEMHPLGILEQAELNALPAVGHGEAMNLPDLSHLTWQYEEDRTGAPHPRNNTDLFLQAAENIHGKLSQANGNGGKPWLEFSGRVRRCLEFPTESLEEKFLKWQEVFPEVRLEYDPNQWRQQALSGHGHDWDHLADADDFGRLSFKATGELRWFLFHLAARFQRDYVDVRVA